MAVDSQGSYSGPSVAAQVRRHHSPFSSISRCGNDWKVFIVKKQRRTSSAGNGLRPVSTPHILGISGLFHWSDWDSWRQRVTQSEGAAAVQVLCLACAAGPMLDVGKVTAPQPTKQRLCSQSEELLSHLLLSCVSSREVWARCLHACYLQQLQPGVEEELGPWWLRCRKRIDKVLRKGFDTLVVLVWWQIWRERTARVFNDKHVTVQSAQLVQGIRDEGSQWVAVGYVSLRHLLFHWLCVSLS
jgi:hypothetical protein